MLTTFDTLYLGNESVNQSRIAPNTHRVPGPVQPREIAQYRFKSYCTKVQPVNSQSARYVSQRERSRTVLLSVNRQVAAHNGFYCSPTTVAIS